MTRTHPQSSSRLRRAAALVALLVLGAAAVPAAATDRVVVVQPGDTLSEIALAHGLTVARLAALNGIADPDRIYVGERLRLSVPPPASPKPAAGPAPAAPVVHVVSWGENLTRIARRYGTTVAAVALANGLADPSYLRVGQRLTIPSTAAPAAEASGRPKAAEKAPLVHVVRSGENLSGIALRYGTSITAIARANQLANPSYLRIGQQLTIPGASGTTIAGASAPAAMTGRDAIGAIIRSEAQSQGVPVAFALAVAWQESGWRAAVVSRAGAVGVMQLTPATADWVGKTMLGHRVDLFDPRSNVHAGVRLLRHYLDRYAGDKSLVLAAYYQGQTAADRYGVYAITRPYIASILALEARFGP